MKLTSFIIDNDADGTKGGTVRRFELIFALREMLDDRQKLIDLVNKEFDYIESMLIKR